MFFSRVIASYKNAILRNVMKTLAILVLATSAVASAADLTGSWGCQVETDMGSGTPSFELKQEGNNIKGKYSGALGEADVTGTVTGSKFEMSFKFDQGTVVYRGEVNGAESKGTVDLAGQASGKFTCKKN